MAVAWRIEAWRGVGLSAVDADALEAEVVGEDEDDIGSIVRREAVARGRRRRLRGLLPRVEPLRRGEGGEERCEGREASCEADHS